MTTFSPSPEAMPGASIGGLREQIITEIIAGDLRRATNIGWPLLRQLGVAYLESDGLSRFVDHEALNPQVARVGVGRPVRLTTERRELMLYTATGDPLSLRFDQSRAEPKHPFVPGIAYRIGDMVPGHRPANVETLCITSPSVAAKLTFDYRSEQAEGLTVPMAEAILQIPENPTPVQMMAGALSLRAA